MRTPPLQFTIRDLLWSTFGCAVYLGALTWAPVEWRGELAILLGWALLAVVYVRLGLRRSLIVHCVGILVAAAGGLVSVGPPGRGPELTVWEWVLEYTTLGCLIGIAFSLLYSLSRLIVVLLARLES